MLRMMIAAATLMVTADVAKAADTARGKELYAQCIACHSLDGSNGVGPSLKGVIGRRAGAIEDFRYSPAMRRVSLVWDEASLADFIMNPQAVVPGSRMPFSGLAEADDRTNLAAFIARIAP